MSPNIAPTFFIAQFIQMGKRLGRFCALVVGVVDDEAPRGDAMVPQDDAHTGHEELGPGNLAVAKHPRQGRQRIRAEAGTLETGPANGVGHKNGCDTKCQPGSLRSRHRMVWLMRANCGINGFNKGPHKGGWLPKNHRRLQAIGDAQASRNGLTILA